MLSTEWLGVLLEEAPKVPCQPLAQYLIYMRRFCVGNKRKRQLVPDMTWVASNRGLSKTMKVNCRYLRTKYDSLELNLCGEPIVCRGMCVFVLVLGARILKSLSTVDSRSQPPGKVLPKFEAKMPPLEFWVFHLGTNYTTDRRASRAAEAQ